MSAMKLLEKELRRQNYELSDETLKKLCLYRDMLLDWNSRVNLTAITDKLSIEVKHFVDSATALPFVRGGALADVGTGAGFPGLALKILRPSLNVTLIDSLGKRIKFLEAVTAALGLGGIKCVQARAEEIGRDSAYRGQFDAVTARAVAKLPILAELTLPLCRVGGIAIAMKGADIGQEIDAGKPSIHALGADIALVKSLALPAFGEEEAPQRSLVVLRKTSNTAAKYPRPYSQIAKGPIKP